MGGGGGAVGASQVPDIEPGTPTIGSYMHKAGMWSKPQTPSPCDSMRQHAVPSCDRASHIAREGDAFSMLYRSSQFLS